MIKVNPISKNRHGFIQIIQISNFRSGSFLAFNCRISVRNAIISSYGGKCLGIRLKVSKK